MIETVKPAEDGRGVVVWLFEAHSARWPVTFTVNETVKAVEVCGLLDKDAQPIAMDGGTIRLRLAPYEIVTLRLLL